MIGFSPNGNAFACARHPSRLTRGFTLIELLTVLAIISILSVLVFTAVQPISDAYGVTNAGLAVRDALDEAKQISMSDNLSVQVRFCRSTQASPSVYSWVLICEVEPDGSLQVVDHALHLSSAVCAASSSTLSSLMSNTEIAALPTDPGITTMGQQYAYRKLTYYPSGATDLTPSSIWFVTMVPQRLNATTTLPTNYATIQIDPVNGLTELYRP